MAKPLIYNGLAINYFETLHLLDGIAVPQGSCPKTPPNMVDRLSGPIVQRMLKQGVGKSMDAYEHVVKTGRG